MRGIPIIPVYETLITDGIIYRVTLYQSKGKSTVWWPIYATQFRQFWTA